MGTAALSFSLLALAPLCLAQQPGKAPAPAKEPFTLPAGEIKLPELIDRCAAWLDCNILWTPIEFRAAAPMTVREAVRTDRAGCLELLANSLQAAGFALTWLDERHGTLEAISLLGPRSREIMGRAEFVSEEQLAAAPNLRMPVIVLVQLQHMNAVVAANKLRPTLGANLEPGGQVVLGNVGIVPALILAGMRPEVAKAIRLIRETDQPSPDSPTDRAKRIASLEKRIAALEAQLAAPPANGGDKPAGSAEKPK